MIGHAPAITDAQKAGILYRPHLGAKCPGLGPVGHLLWCYTQHVSQETVAGAVKNRQASDVQTRLPYLLQACQWRHRVSESTHVSRVTIGCLCQHAQHYTLQTPATKQRPTSLAHALRSHQLQRALPHAAAGVLHQRAVSRVCKVHKALLSRVSHRSGHVLQPAALLQTMSKFRCLLWNCPC